MNKFLTFVALAAFFLLMSIGIHVVIEIFYAKDAGVEALVFNYGPWGWITLVIYYLGSIAGSMELASEIVDNNY